MITKSIFKPFNNCWRVTEMKNGAMLIDSANFYRAIHESIIKAKHSIFIVGWEIDSTIRLLRGDEEKISEYPSVISDLLSWKAEHTPEIQIYLLRWDSSVTFVKERELLPEHVWTSKTPENLHIFLDSTIPMCGSHHQKIILIDDEIVFTGGMDVARQRWDEREHRIIEPERTDILGPYTPYHDVQIVMDGPIVQDMAELVRWRWKRAAGYEAHPIRTLDTTSPALAPTWPQRFPPFFKNMTCAIARTIPWMGDHPEVKEIRQMYLDLIERAERFIYVENQFMTYKEIAEAINRQLKKKPDLQVLFVGSYKPNGLFETECLWAGRIDFKEILEDGVERHRVRMVHSQITDENDEMHHKKIHSKVFVVDDRYMTVGSSNIDNRSMSLDTECDIVLEANSDEEAKMIAQVRNDLLAEHMGLTISEVQSIFENPYSIDTIINSANKDSYHLDEISDSQFTNKSLQSVTQLFADPEKPLISIPDPELGMSKPLRNPRKHKVVAGLIAISAIAFTIFFIREHLDWFKPESIRAFLEMARNSNYALPLVCLIYILGGLVLFPVTVMSLTTAAVFGSVLGPIYGMIGALSSAALMFLIGHVAGLKGLRKLFGDRIRKIDHHFQKTGVIGIAVLRLLPIAPYSLVNLAAGMSSVTFFDFIAGSFLGFLPAFIAKGLVGDSLVQVFLNPTFKTTMYLILGIIAWFVLVFSSYFLAKRWKAKQMA